MQRMSQNKECFAQWYPHVRDQAKQCIWAGYDMDRATRDTILLQTKDSRLQQKILSEDLNYANTIKYGLSLEQGKKIDEIISSQSRPEDTRVAQLREEVRKLGKQAELRRTGASNIAGREGGVSIGVSCSTCTRPPHIKGDCPGKKVEYYGCRLTGHFKGSTACKGKAAGEKMKTGKERANQVDGSEEESKGDSIGQVSEDFIWPAGIPPKSKIAELQLTAPDQGSRSKQTKANLLIDSGVYRTLLMEEQWRDTT